MSILFCLLKAWMIGFAIAAPVGPIGMICITKTLELGFRGAFIVGLGAALADSVYGVVAALGLSAISHALLNNANVIRLVGGVFLLYLAYKELKSINNNTDNKNIESKKPIKLLSKTFFLTITNPITILSFVGIFASIGSGASSALDSMAMVLGIFLGSMTWWCLLGGIIVNIKHRLPNSWLARIKWLSCSILAGFGVVAVAGYFMH